MAACLGPVLVDELERLVAEHPLQERLVGFLMVALYRAGRRARALEVMAAARRRLPEDLGLQPGPPLRAIEAGILREDPPLLTAPNGRPRAVAKRRPSRRRWIAPGAATVALAIGAA